MKWPEPAFDIASHTLPGLNCGMKAAQLVEIRRPVQISDIPEPEPREDEAVIQLNAAALNRRDYWITQGMYPGITLPCVLGSDGCGVVSATGNAVSKDWIGREVIINPGINWGQSDIHQSDEFRILGMPDDGTLAERVAVPAGLICRKPAHLSAEEAAALPLAGVTAYRALFTQGQFRPGQKVLISGIGGGVATLALQFAVAAGGEVYVSSSSSEKTGKAIAMGATGGFLYTGDHWQKKAPAMDLIIDGAGGPGYNQLLSLISPGGTIVNYGATAGPPSQVDFFKLFWKQARLIGSTMGSPMDFSAMMEFVEKHQIRPVVDRVYPLDQAGEAIERMGRAPQFGKTVVKIRP